MKNTSSNVNEVYVADYLVVASGENSKGYIPEVDGLEKCEGVYMHCSMYLMEENGMTKMSLLLVLEILAWRSLMISSIGVQIPPWLLEVL